MFSTRSMQVHASNVVLVPVSACAPARALSCTSACVPEGLPADLPTPVRCMHSSARDCVRACNTNTSRHARKHLQRRSAERKTLNCQLYIGSASFCMWAETKKMHKNQNVKYSSAAVDKLCLQFLSCICHNVCLKILSCRGLSAECTKFVCSATIFVMQRLCRGCTGVVQRLCRGYAEAV